MVYFIHFKYTRFSSIVYQSLHQVKESVFFHLMFKWMFFSGGKIGRGMSLAIEKN